MSASDPLAPLGRLRTRLDALPLDRAPLRRAGLLALLLVALLGFGRLAGPDRTTAAEGQDLRAATEDGSGPAAPSRSAPSRSSSAWTGGRVVALLFLAAGGGIAFWLHRRSPHRVAQRGSTLEVIETHPLGPGTSLRLVACGDEVLLLSVASEGTTLLRHWPRATFGAGPRSFADALALAESSPDTRPSPHVPHDASLKAARVAAGTAEPAAEARRPDPAVLPEPQLAARSLDVAEASLPVHPTAPHVGEAGPHGRGALFPTRAPRQFGVQHG